MSWRHQPLYVVEWAGGDRLPYTKKIYTSLTWAKKYLFNYMKKNLAEGYIQLHQPHGVGNIMAISRQKFGGLVEVEIFEDEEVVEILHQTGTTLNWDGTEDFLFRKEKLEP